MIKNYKYLCYTNLLLLLSIFYFFLQYINNTIYSKVEYIFVFFLIITIILSQIFWNNPIKNSRIHRIDTINTRIVMTLCILYTLIYKFKFSLLFVLLIVIISSYFSNYYSKQEWCSNKHIFWHGILHIFCFIGTFYLFSPKKS